MGTLVTGGTGFVGANIIRELARSGHEVISFDIAPADDLVRRFVSEWESRITFVQGDVRDQAVVTGLSSGHNIDKIIHAVTYTVNQHALEVERGRDVVGINVEGLANVLELARIARVQRIVLCQFGCGLWRRRRNRSDLQRGNARHARLHVRHNQIRRRTHNAAVRSAARFLDRRRPAEHTLRPHGAGNGPPRRDVCPVPVDGAGGSGRAAGGADGLLPTLRRAGTTPTQWTPRGASLRFWTPPSCPTTCTT